MAIGYVNKLETFGLVDGPGVRYIVFLQGCHMRCKYCHNPETWARKTAETQEWDSKELFKRAYRYKNYWRNNGGITVSGGEPLLQMEFVIDFFKEAKAKGIHTTIDTSGNPFTREEPFFSQFEELMKYTDLVMLDLKHTDPTAHKELTGQDNDNILDMARYLSSIGKDMWIRRVLVPGISDDPAELARTKEFIDSLGDCVKRVEILPYHTLALAKWENLKIPYPLDGVPPPTFDEIYAAEKILDIHVHDNEANQRQAAKLTPEHEDRLLRGCN